MGFGRLFLHGCTVFDQPVQCDVYDSSNKLRNVKYLMWIPILTLFLAEIE